jgi:uncharacterized protein YegL
MPKLMDVDNKDMSQVNVGTSFTYSATRIEKLGATEYTLVSIITDISGSVSSYKDSLEKCISEIVKACKYSPRADNLMLRLLLFNSAENEYHGFKLLANCNPDDYLNILNCGGATALFDASYNGIEATNNYGKNLTDNDFSVNGIVFVLTDGDDNSSTYGISKVKDSLEKSVKQEYMESMVSVLIGINTNNQINSYLDDFHKQAGFTQYLNIGDADSKKLAKLAEFVSKSISSQSQSLGTGGPSKQISLTF